MLADTSTLQKRLSHSDQTRLDKFLTSVRSLEVRVADGDEVRAGQVLCIVEAMKMENEIGAHRDGVVTGLSVTTGQQVKTGQVICVVEAGGSEPDG